MEFRIVLQRSQGGEWMAQASRRGRAYYGHGSSAWEAIAHALAGVSR